MKIINHISILCCIFLTGCSQQPESFVTASFPVTKECAQRALQKYKDVIKVDTIKVSYSKFDFKLISHPEIEGYLTIDSHIHKTKGDLEGLFNTSLFDCHATSTTNLKIQELSRFIPLMKPDYAYIKVQGDNAVMVYRESHSNK